MEKNIKERKLNFKNYNLKSTNYRNHTFESNRGITLIALIVTIVFSYDEKLKCSNNKGFLLAII